MKRSKIVIVGAGGSGKDHLTQRFIEKGFKPSISHTTRPPRPGESEGVDYYFVNSTAFRSLIKADEFYEYKEFNNWFYGVSKVAFDKADLFIMTPPAIEEMDKETRDKCLVIYLDIPEEIRAKRISQRNDADDVKRRISVDREMFDCFTNYDIRVSDPIFD